MEILNLYSGIGGNRKLWTDCNVTAVEYDKDIAAVYQDQFPNDKVIVADAHEFLLQNYMNYDFIWSSPPCQTHSQIRFNIGYKANRIYEKVKAVYPEISLYQEIIFLQQFCKGLFCVENVIGYYEPLIKTIEIGRHYLWTNFAVPKIELPKTEIGTMMKQYVGKIGRAHV